jgi:predicted ATP-grasp superfamily ATP-dependent carboligase
VLDAEMQCSIPLMESLWKQGFHITAGSYKRINMGFFSRYPARRVVYPSPENSPRAFVERILDLAKEHAYSLILPVDDFSSGILSAYRDCFAPYTQIPIVPFDTFTKARDKGQTMRIAMQEGVPCPQTFFPDSQKIEEIVREAHFPVLVKANVSSGARGISLVEKKDDLEATYLRVRAGYGECHIQEFIPKGGRQYVADFFLDMKQEQKAAIVYSKLRFFPVNGGSSVLNRTVHEPEILKYGYRLLRAMNWYGFADLDFIIDPRDGLPKVMEVNPRLPTTLRISLAAGMDFPRMLVNLAMGEEISTSTGYRLDVYLRHLPMDVLWFLKSPERFRARPSFFKIWEPALYDQILCLHDPGPTVGFVLDNLVSLLDRSSRKARFSRGW